MEPGQDGDVGLHEGGYWDVGLCFGVGGSGGVGVDGVNGADNVGSGGCGDSGSIRSVGRS